MAIDLSSLNTNQLTSVNWAEGPLLVLAGPGSGKTRVLTYRIARILEETAGQPFRILGLTFTNRAAAEMRNRIDALVPDAGERVLLTTFHSFGVGVLRQHGHHIGLRPDFAILSQAVDREAVLDEAILRTQGENGEAAFRAEGLLPVINRLLDDCVPPDGAARVLRQRGTRNADAIGAVYTKYREVMLTTSQLDFGGLIAETIRLLDDFPAVRRLISRVYSFVCVDEFQDTNLAQYRILRNIVGQPRRNLFVVADDDQIIYQWNGADPERLKSLQRDFGMRTLQLPENYRCPPDVVDIANKLIAHNLSRDVNKADLIANRSNSQGGVVRVRAFASFDEEADWVASEIARLDGAARADCVVLARTRKLLERVIEALESHGLKGHLEIRKNEFVSGPMIWLHAMLRLANARQDREQLRRVCKSFFGLEGISLAVGDVIADAAAEEGDYLRAWQRMALRRDGLEPETRDLLEQAVTGLADRLDFRSFVEASFRWFDGLPGRLPPGDDGLSEYDGERDTWRDLTREVTAELGRDQVTLNTLLQGLDLRAKTPRPPEGGIVCYTIHMAKGLEFRHVYLVGLVEEHLPSWTAIRKGDESQEMQEERRNCFVAITRVQDGLTLTYSGEVFGWPKRPSRFLREMELVT